MNEIIRLVLSNKITLACGPGIATVIYFSSLSMDTAGFSAGEVAFDRSSTTAFFC